MSGLFSPPTQTQQTNSTTAPWAPQQPYINQGLQGAQNIYNQQSAVSPYSGELYAQLNPGQLSAIQGLNGYAANGGSAVANNLTTAGSGALSGLSQAQSGAQNVANAGMTNQTQQNIQNATAYANNPATAGMIQAANQPIENQLNQVSVPGLNINAAQSGNSSSSRAGTAEAIMRNSAAIDEGNNAANIVGNQYNNGLNLSQNAATAGMNAANSADNTLAGVGTAGAGALSTGYNDNINNMNIPLQTGALQQANQQGVDTAGLTQYNNTMQEPWSVLDNYFNVASKPLGSQTNGTTTTTGGGPSLAGGLLGAAAGIGSLFAPTGAFGTGPSIMSGIGNMFGSGGDYSGGGGLPGYGGGGG